MHEFVRHMPSGDCQTATYVQLLFQRPLSLSPHHSGIVGTVIGATGDKDQRLRVLPLTFALGERPERNKMSEFIKIKVQYTTETHD